jgi:hypothetical protein
MNCKKKKCAFKTKKNKTKKIFGLENLGFIVSSVLLVLDLSLLNVVLTGLGEDK